MLLQKFVEILNGHLTKDNKKLVHRVHFEMKMNHHIREINDFISPIGLFIPFLPAVDGDCLFRSLSPHMGGIGIQDLRNILATVMRAFKTQKHFLPCNETPLEELFEHTNEIKYVSCNDKNGQVRIYKYTYDIGDV